MRKNRISLFFFNHLKRVFGKTRERQFHDFIRYMNYDVEADPSNVY